MFSTASAVSMIGDIQNAVVGLVEVTFVEPVRRGARRAETPGAGRRIPAGLGAGAGLLRCADHGGDDPHRTHVEHKADEADIGLSQPYQRSRAGGTEALHLGLNTGPGLRGVLAVDDDEVESRCAEQLGDRRRAEPELCAKRGLPGVE